MSNIFCTIRGSAKAIAAAVVGAGVAYVAQRGFDPTLAQQAAAVGVISGVVVWFTRNAKCA